LDGTWSDMGSGRPGPLTPNAAFPGYTTEVFDTHKEVFDTHKTEADRIFYPWHPLYGRELAISGKCIRRGTVMFICRVRGVRMLTPLEVPAWMFDSAVCCRLIAAPSARVDVTALFSLRALLNSASGQSAVVKAQHHSTVFGGSDAQKPQTITIQLAMFPPAEVKPPLPANIRSQLRTLLVKLLRDASQHPENQNVLRGDHE
jgi:hypothetical protein